jgi:hypothetical protein
VIACSECGWAAICASEQLETRVWSIHQETTGCSAEPLRARSPSPYRAKKCLKGHDRDILGICWTCFMPRGEVVEVASGGRGRRRRW